MKHFKPFSGVIVLALSVALLSCLIGAHLPVTALPDPDTPLAAAPRSIPTPASASLTWSRPTSRSADDPDWSSGGPAGVNVRTLAIHPTDPNVILAGGDSGVYTTPDSGITWQAVMTDTNIYSLSVDPLTPDTVYAGAWEGVYKTTDGGDTWQMYNEDFPSGPSIRAIALDPDTPSTVYVGTIRYGVFKSVNGGSSWTSSSAGLPSELDVHALGIDPVSTDTLYAATSEGVFKTVDGAQTWVSSNAGLHSGAFRALVVDPGAPETVYTASLYNGYYAGVYKSSDGGTTWELARSGIVGADPRALASASDVLYVATDGGVFRSVDGGRRWQGIYPDRPPSMQINTLAVSGENPQTVYLGTWSSEQAYRGVWQSTLTFPPPLTLSPAHPPKAVLIVGPIDAPTNEATQAAIDAMETRASLLESFGLQVVRLYHPNATWENIRANLTGATLVLYDGHGFGYNPDDSNYLSTGGSNNGFCITDPDNLSGATLATQDELIAYSQLAENAVVMIFACFSPGGSASDTTVVSETVAKRRVNDYSYTFLTIGADAYFAGGDWNYYLNQMLDVLDDTTGAAYTTGPGYDPAALRAFSHTQYADNSLWLDPSVNSQGEVLGWWSAFAGDPDLTGRTVLGRADFTATLTSGVAPLTVDFTNTTASDFADSLWDFGDGVTSTLESPTHTYTTAGVHTVTLTVSGWGGADIVIRTNYITAYEPVKADFTASRTSAVTRLTIEFTNTSAGDYDESLWDFGDEVTSTQESPTHAYMAPGAYTVTLTISGPGGTHARTKPEYIIVESGTHLFLPCVLRDGIT